MSDFEYIAVLLSIILGLGITRLLTGIARLVRDRRSLAPAWWVMQCVQGSPLVFDFDTRVRLSWLVLAVPGFLSRRVLVQATLAVTHLVVFVVHSGLLFMRIR